MKRRAGPPRSRGGRLVPHKRKRAHRFATGRTTGRPAAMDIIGLDLHQRESQLCLCDADGTVTERRIVTSRERFTAVLGDRKSTRLNSSHGYISYAVFCLKKKKKNDKKQDRIITRHRN